ncbi:hypothetical protein [Cerasicoccus fimbriatus]|uniref:hypothetical protein n=1 Tax=Cerasicoccus fimbriatus TaxID=3014554 RepID=UPI0022B4C351|nr:hypothetical protein [Cerasicoccus sp. TK19100]
MAVKKPSAHITTSSRISLIVSNMSRLFFSHGNKIVSVNIPFYIYQGEDGYLHFESKAIGEVTPFLTSLALSIVSSSHFGKWNSIWDYIDLFDLHDDQSDTRTEQFLMDFNNFFFNLMCTEDGYLRYDYDNDPDRVDPEYHPEHHIDIFYSTSNTFKVGLRGALNCEDVISILDIESKCHFILPPN